MGSDDISRQAPQGGAGGLILGVVRRHWVTIVVVVAGVLWFIYAPRERVDVPGPEREVVRYLPAPREVERIIEREAVRIGNDYRIEFFPKEETAKRLKMPELKTTPGGITAVGEVPPGRTKGTAVATLSLGNDNVYRGGILFREDPPKRVEFLKGYGVRGEYLFSGSNKMEAEVYVQPIRLFGADITLGGGVEVRRHDDSVRARYGVSVNYRF